MTAAAAMAVDGGDAAAAAVEAGAAFRAEVMTYADGNSVGGLLNRAHHCFSRKAVPELQVPPLAPAALRAQ